MGKISNPFKIRYARIINKISHHKVFIYTTSATVSNFFISFRFPSLFLSFIMTVLCDIVPKRDNDERQSSIRSYRVDAEGTK